MAWRIGVSPEDRNDLLELLARYTSIPDTKNWDELPLTVFADRVLWDYESLTGEPAVDVAREAFIEHIQPAFDGWAATHHATTNYRVEVTGDEAPVRADIRT